MLASDAAPPRSPRRVLVAGVAGVGKTTLAQRIARVSPSPHTEIDALFHGADWVPRPEFVDEVRALGGVDAAQVPRSRASARVRASSARGVRLRSQREVERWLAGPLTDAAHAG